MPNVDTRNKTPLSGAAHLTVGLSPTYWSHVPLCVYQIHTLRLVQGISCLVLPSKGDTQQQQETLIPISRCRLVGTIVNVERTSKSVLYVVDDGTGLVDCVYWLDRDEYTLPSLLDDHPQADTNNCGILQVGDVVCVLGRLECVAMRVRGPNTTTTNITDTSATATVAVGERHATAIREIHASVVQPISASSYSKALPQTLDAESQHWTNCVSLLSSSSLKNAKHVLELLGPDITAQVLGSQSNSAVSQDYTGAWRVFGMECRCKLAYKDALLYCHCQATPEATDSGYTYRDAVLQTLLRMEKNETHAPLRFQYRTIANDSNLNRIAVYQLSKGNVQHLVINTFRALRQDGILYLLDAHSDTYIFISRDRVLEPFVRTMQSTSLETAPERKNLRQNRPGYLSKVPKARLELIRNDLRLAGETPLVV